VEPRCKGKCDRRREASPSGWEDVYDLTIPARYLQWVLSAMGGLRIGQFRMEEEAWEQFWAIAHILGQRVFRNQSDEEIRKYQQILHYQEVSPFF
jgi:hypothetical protein